MQLRRRNRRLAGFTILEIMVVLLIVGLIIGTIGQNAWQAMFAGQEGTAKNQIRSFNNALDQYKLHFYKYPERLEDLVSGEGAPGGEPFMRIIPLDPWSNEYHYELAPGGAPVIISYGADGQPGGEGKDADISSEDL